MLRQKIVHPGRSPNQLSLQRRGQLPLVLILEREVRKILPLSVEVGDRAHPRLVIGCRRRTINRIHRGDQRWVCACWRSTKIDAKARRRAEPLPIVYGPTKLSRDCKCHLSYSFNTNTANRITIGQKRGLLIKLLLLVTVPTGCCVTSPPL